MYQKGSHRALRVPRLMLPVPAPLRRHAASAIGDLGRVSPLSVIWTRTRKASEAEGSRRRPPENAGETRETARADPAAERLRIHVELPADLQDRLLKIRDESEKRPHGAAQRRRCHTKRPQHPAKRGWDAPTAQRSSNSTSTTAPMAPNREPPSCRKTEMSDRRPRNPPDLMVVSVRNV